ncbi:MAG TPA: hypothetical protein VFW11_18205 [Cyclobacteriaceae bacterium]|nr:hypothetical protein [Cyclobacteriaceae bacterium]
MYKLFVVVSLLLFVYNASAQKFYPVKLIFEDGRVLKGQANALGRPLDKSISFRENEKSEKTEYESDGVKTVVYYFDKDTIEYDHVKTFPMIGKKLTQPIWLEVLERGYVTLYFTVKFGSTVVRSGVASKELDDHYWLCSRPTEEAAYVVSWVSGYNANSYFKSKAPKYFSDYPELVEKINEKTYKYSDIIAVVKDYNKWHSKK